MSSKFKHIPYTEDKQQTGTLKFASVNTHFGVEQSRRDDLEALAYTLIYLAKGNLPWSGMSKRGRNCLEDWESVLNIKKDQKPEEICEGLHEEFIQFLEYCRRQEFDERPRLQFFKDALVRSILERRNVV